LFLFQFVVEILTFKQYIQVIYTVYYTLYIIHPTSDVDIDLKTRKYDEL